MLAQLQVPGMLLVMLVVLVQLLLALVVWVRLLVVLVVLVRLPVMLRSSQRASASVLQQRWRRCRSRALCLLACTRRKEPGRAACTALARQRPCRMQRQLQLQVCIPSMVRGRGPAVACSRQCVGGRKGEGRGGEESGAT